MLFHCVKDVVCVHFCVPCFECIVDVVPYRPYLNVTIPSVLTSVLHTFHLYRASRYIFFYCWSVVSSPYLHLLCSRSCLWLPRWHFTFDPLCGTRHFNSQQCQSNCIGISLSSNRFGASISFDNELAKFEYDASLRWPSPMSHLLTSKKAHDIPNGPYWLGCSIFQFKWNYSW